jgi:hypothetical protein
MPREYAGAVSRGGIVKRRHAEQAISDDEQVARYAYLLGNVPVSVADRAYAAAFAGLPVTQRHELVAELRSQLPAEPKSAASDDPYAFAVLMRDLHARSALVTSRHAAAFAAQFIASAPIAAYFVSGAGSVSIEHQPLCVNELVGHESAPIDAGRMHHRPGVDSGERYGS